MKLGIFLLTIGGLIFLYGFYLYVIVSKNLTKEFAQGVFNVGTIAVTIGLPLIIIGAKRIWFKDKTVK